MNKLWALVDCNNFYASCEKLFRPDLLDKPVVVLSNNDGCIVARSAEAKQLGIKMGEPEFKIRPFLKANHVHVFSSNYALYGDISNRVMATLETVCPIVEQYSIDEAFVPLTGPLVVNAEEIAWTMRETVRQWTGIMVSVGIAPTKTLAKVANHIAKKTDGVRLLTNPAELPDVLRATPVSDIWGIGRRHAEKLQRFGIQDALTFSRMGDTWLRHNFTVTGLRTAWELQGRSCLDDSELPTPRKTLVSSRSFGQKVTDRDTLKHAVAHFTSVAAERLRKENLLAGGIAVHIRTSPHVDGEQHNDTLQRSFVSATADTSIMQRTALQLLDGMFRNGPAYAKAGVMLFDLTSRDIQQGNLLMLDRTDDKTRNSLMQTLDAINKKFGRHTVKFAAEGINDAGWGMRQKHLSPRYTTDWKGLALAKCS